jgi:hypothetical protein
MVEILIERGLNLLVEGGKLVVSPKTKLTDGLREFIREHKDILIRELLELQTQKLESLFSSAPDLLEQFDFEVEERIAIMIFDGGSAKSHSYYQ